MSVIQQPAKKLSAALVSFTYGSPVKTQAYTDWTVDIQHGSLAYVSTPIMNVKSIEDSGFIDDKPVTIILPLDAFTDRISSGEPHGRINVEVLEKMSSDDDDDIKHRFTGIVDIAYRNFQRRVNMVGLECRTWKSYLEGPTGISVDHQCPWTVYDPNSCAASKAGKTATGVVAAISDSSIDVIGLPSRPDFFWNRGWLDFDGLRLMIRYWQNGITFLTNRRPPGYWVGQAVTLTAGCDGTIETCRSVHANESNFGGAGYGMTPYNPVFETE